MTQKEQLFNIFKVRDTIVNFLILPILQNKKINFKEKKNKA
jgi:hypothetical protein